MPGVVVIGAGAAGTMAAIASASAGAETILLERTKDGGRKILISGGGRCNILPAEIDESRFVTDSSPRLIRHLVRSWPLREQMAFFERELALPLVEEREAAKLFPKSQSAREVRDKLLAFARHSGAAVITGSLVTGVEPGERGWVVSRQNQEPIRADAVILATGGLSVPSTGSDGTGLRIAERLGHVVHPTYPALTPLVNRADGARFEHLSGVSLPVTITARSSRRTATARGGFLFTHRGYSGPAVLDISHVAVRSLTEADSPALLTVQWSSLTGPEWEIALRPRGTRTVVSALVGHVPQRLAETLLEQAGIEPARPLSQMTRAERLRLIDTLTRGVLPWTGDEGYRKAEVTGGGVSLAEVDPKTLESRRHRGLFLCGEMLDAFGPIGGYNFFWAWVTGRIAGLGAAAHVLVRRNFSSAANLEP